MSEPEKARQTDRVKKATEPAEVAAGTHDDSRTSIPEYQRSPSLRESIDYFVNVTAGFKEANKDFPHQTNLFLFLVYPWVVDAAGNAEVEAALEQRRRELTEKGFDGVEARDKLNQILAEDA